jgi:hypothetical protein
LSGERGIWSGKGKRIKEKGKREKGKGKREKGKREKGKGERGKGKRIGNWAPDMTFKVFLTDFT